MIAPTKETYTKWYEDRLNRTYAVAKVQTRITGRQVRNENLSVSLLAKLGFVLDPDTDTLEHKTDG